MIIPQIILVLAMAYCAAAWIGMAVHAYRNRAALIADESLRREVQAHTFHLGLCCIVAAGFLGLLVK